jgi:hypothetical protein
MRPLLCNGSVSTFPLQRIGAVTDELLVVVISLLFVLSYKREFIPKGVQRFSRKGVQKPSVRLWSVNQRTMEVEEVTDS